ncbi:hypothetical protein JDV02_010568 [Purpureocillium takamizusanense]|uniref:Uncharacterized protein n=1 Tax=Purpureocillium takamizusanense TaxID=2060973 RepID=A0A9Q8QS26_9HYPO|nr:uncharacterized protein JDV02_010568 [Purpureocillium takamizusanense]UNI24850.1 hypothetical protein JDV02_010568 [Purpureocillium takamizusanense]
MPEIKVANQTLVPPSKAINPNVKDVILRSTRFNVPMLEAMNLVTPGMRYLGLKLDNNLGLTVDGLPSREQFDRMSETEIVELKGRLWARVEARKDHGQVGQARVPQDMLRTLWFILSPGGKTTHVHGNYLALRDKISQLLIMGEGAAWSARSVLDTVQNYHGIVKREIHLLRAFRPRAVQHGRRTLPLERWLPALAARIRHVDSVHYRGEASEGSAWERMTNTALRLDEEVKAGKANAGDDLVAVMNEMADYATQHFPVDAVEEMVKKLHHLAHDDSAVVGNGDAEGRDGDE